MKYYLSVPQPTFFNRVCCVTLSFALTLLSTEFASLSVGEASTFQLLSVTAGMFVALTYIYGKSGIVGVFFGLVFYYSFINIKPSGIGYLYTLIVSAMLMLSLRVIDGVKNHPHATKFVFGYFVFLVPGITTMLLSILAPNELNRTLALHLYLTDSIGILITAPIIAAGIYSARKLRSRQYVKKLIKSGPPPHLLCKFLLVVTLIAVLNKLGHEHVDKYLYYMLLAPLVILAVLNFSEMTQVVLIIIGFNLLIHSHDITDLRELNNKLALFLNFSLIIYIMLDYKLSLRKEVKENTQRLYFDKQSGFNSYQKLEADTNEKRNFVVAALDLTPAFKYPADKRDNILRHISVFFQKETHLFDQCFILYDVSSLIIVVDDNEHAITKLADIPYRLNGAMNEKYINFSTDRIYYCRCSKGIRIRHAVTQLNTNMRLAEKNANATLINCDNTDYERYILMLEDLSDDNINILRQNYLDCQDPAKQRFELLSRFTVNGDILNTGHVFHCAQKLGHMESLEKKILYKQLQYINSLSENSYETASINLTPDFLCNSSAIRTLLAFVKHQHIPAQKICIEVVESGEIEDQQLLVDNLNRLKKAEFQVALDDFGAGHSTFNQLLSMPIDIVKIDGALVRDCDKNFVKQQIIENLRTITNVSHIKVVAECVETEDEQRFLASMGIDYLQGYLVHKPTLVSIFD
ncbi:EAL domain-containing protein [Enterovibrio sp. ZSDZ35]|uniref:EAL domain-containing protein n=1 Tax=Enterovibrio qingdaonensis TaxID=2899818 RepID=A0ABT5QP98_9GAMM|nr:EAL domain-containing protein [Enterovibrio sp. ZSDZ35]MDD1782816.1 EAL domain-containing protein [Enterovibrio sp. ZSDZ35]